MSRADDRGGSTRSYICLYLIVKTNLDYSTVVISHEKMVCARPRALSELECVVRK